MTTIKHRHHGPKGSSTADKWVTEEIAQTVPDPAVSDLTPLLDRISALENSRVTTAELATAVVGLDARLRALETPAPPPVPVPDPVPVPTTAGIASGSASSKNNYQIGRTLNGDVSMRLRKRGTGSVSGFRWQQRFGGTYSAGDGGTLTATCQLDKNGAPDNNVLASVTFKPGTNGGKADAAFGTTMFNAPTPNIPDGALFHIVLSGGTAGAHISLNALFKWGDDKGMPRQPTFTDAELALLVNTGSGWHETNDTPNVDVLPAHEGFGYSQCLTQYWQAVGGQASGLDKNDKPVTRGSASGNKCRQTFTVDAPAPYSKLQMRVRLDHGSSPLTLTLERADGSVVSSGSAKGIPQSSSGGDNGGQTWAIYTVPGGGTLSPGTYRLVASCPADTAYTVTPIRRCVLDNVTGSDWQSYMANGLGEYSTDNGQTWASLYTSVHPQGDTQFAVLP